MRRKIPAALAALLAVAALAVTVYAAGGTSADPFITLSYLESIFVKPVRETLSLRSAGLTSHAAGLLDKAIQNQYAYVEKALNEALSTRVMQRVTDKVRAGSTALNMGTMQKLSLSKGDRIVGPPGAGIMLQSGSASTYGSASAQIVNVTLGEPRAAGIAITPNYYYMIVADDGSGIVVTSDKAEFFVRDGARVIKSYTPIYSARADILKDLGLFVGTGNGYELDRPPTRQEALIMLIRLLGEESVALGYTGTSSFTDLTGWADGQKYISYGLNKGYTNGESATTFAQYKFATLEMYLTFVLRSLGYSDAAGDFVWNTTSKTLAVSLGLLTQQDLETIAKTGIMRDHVVQISLNALFVPLKSGGITLGQKLVSGGIISAESLDWAQTQLRAQ